MKTTTRPGDVIREKLKKLRWTQADLAEVTGRHESRINRIINGYTGITAETAHRLAAAFDTTPEFWMDLESRWKLVQPRKVRHERR